jgi:hypothetical protein
MRSSSTCRAQTWLRAVRFRRDAFRIVLLEPSQLPFFVPLRPEGAFFGCAKLPLGPTPCPLPSDLTLGNQLVFKPFFQFLLSTASAGDASFGMRT